MIAGDDIEAAGSDGPFQSRAGVFRRALHDFGPRTERGIQSLGKSAVLSLWTHDDEHLRARSDLRGQLPRRSRVLRMLLRPSDDAEEGAQQQQREQHARTGKVMAEKGKKAAHAVAWIMRAGKTRFKATDVQP